MGIATCDRTGCDTMLGTSGRYSKDHGSICRECFEELRNNPTFELQKFMDSPKDPVDEYLVSMKKQYVENIFGSRI